MTASQRAGKVTSTSPYEAPPSTEGGRARRTGVVSATVPPIAMAWSNGAGRHLHRVRTQFQGWQRTERPQPQHASRADQKALMFG